MGASGLTQVEAERRLRERGPIRKEATSRSYVSIAIANTFTVFNLILAAFGAATIAFGNPRDALFLGILIANVAIGTFQEVRAKRALDRLAALVVAKTTVVRDGQPRAVPVEEVVVGDLVRVGSGDQVTADGELVRADGLALDESELTGESEPVLRHPGDKILSGAFAVEGEGDFEASAVGADSHAARLTATARAFRHPRSPLERAMDRLLIIMVALMAPLGIALGVSLAIRDVSQADAVETLTAGIVNVVPEGLILLVSLTAAVTAAKMARHGILAQQLNAIESLASVSVMCTDKTGTLTEASLRVVTLVPAEGVAGPELAGDLGGYAASAPTRNATLEAIHAAQLGGDGGEPRQPTATIPFSSRRRWSALELGGRRLVLGAPEALLDGAVGQAALASAPPPRPPPGAASSPSPPPPRRCPSRGPRPPWPARSSRWGSSSSPRSSAPAPPRRSPSLPPRRSPSRCSPATTRRPSARSPATSASRPLRTRSTAAPCRPRTPSCSPRSGPRRRSAGSPPRTRRAWSASSARAASTSACSATASTTCRR